jgi:hypothetical protein
MRVPEEQLLVEDLEV